MRKSILFLALTTGVLALTALQSGAQITVATPAFMFGKPGDSPGQFNALRGVGVGTNGDVYVTDALNYRIQQFTSNGTFLKLWGSIGTQAGKFNAPLDLAVDGSNQVFVLDTSNNRIQKFDGNGGFLTQWGGTGSGTGKFSEPRCLAVDRAGNVYVSDTGNNRIQKFDGNGTFLSKWGSAGAASGKFNAPVGIVVDNAGTVYVADQGNYRIQKFANDGAFLTLWGSRGAKAGQFAMSVNANGGPNDLAIDLAGNVVVADGGNDRVQVFTSAGVYIAQFGTHGTGAGQFNLPGRLTFDLTGTVLYVADIENQRVQAFNYTVPPPMILTFAPAGAAAVMSWSAITGRRYQLQYKANLNEGSWSNLGVPIPATDYPGTGPITIDSDARRFYRVALLP